MCLSKGGGLEVQRNMLTIRVYATHMGGLLGPEFSKQGSSFPQIILKSCCVWLDICQKLLKICSFPSKFFIKVGGKASFGGFW